MDTTTLYHNPKCSTSRKAMEAAERLGVEVEVVRYLDTPPDRDTLEALLVKLEDPPADLVRKDAFFKEIGLDPEAYEEADAVVDLLIEHPRLMQRPVLVREGRAIIGRPPERVEDFLSE